MENKERTEPIEELKDEALEAVTGGASTSTSDSYVDTGDFDIPVEDSHEYEIIGSGKIEIGAIEAANGE